MSEMEMKMLMLLMSNNKMKLKQVTTVNNKVTKNNTDIATINTNNGYYYFTNQLKHDNVNVVKFPAVNKHPFVASNTSHEMSIYVSGHYQIIYTDFYKNSGTFKILDTKNGVDGTELFSLELDQQSEWTPITINTVISINANNFLGYADIKLYISSKNNVGIFDGDGFSTFFIKYLGA